MFLLTGQIIWTGKIEPKEIWSVIISDYIMRDYEAVYKR